MFRNYIFYLDRCFSYVSDFCILEFNKNNRIMYNNRFDLFFSYIYILSSSYSKTNVLASFLSCNLNLSCFYILLIFMTQTKYLISWLLKEISGKYIG